VTRLFPGEDAKILQSSRPNQLVAPFRDMLHKDLAAGGRVARKWLDRDYSSATFMNTRMEQADSKRMHKPTQNWLARHVASGPYLRALRWILLTSGQALPELPGAMKKLQAHKVLPDLPEYVDPLKDGQAAIQNIAGGLSTLEDECSSRGRDYQKIIEQHKREAIESDLASVERISALQKAIDDAKATNPDLELSWSQIITVGAATSAPGAYLDGSSEFGQSDPEAEAKPETEAPEPKAKKPPKPKAKKKDKPE
jgi:capsid protein